MADVITPNYGFTEPENTKSDGTWGIKLNANWASVDALLASAFEAPETPDGTLGPLKPGAFGGGSEISGDDPSLTFTETDQTSPAGQWRFRAVDGLFKLEAATTQDWSTHDDVWVHTPGSGTDFHGGRLEVVEANADGSVLSTPLTTADMTGVWTTGMLPDPSTDAAVEGLRWRISGSGTGQVMQWSHQDGGTIQFDPEAAEIGGQKDNGDRGVTFTCGIAIGPNAYQVGGVNSGDIAFLPASLTENNNYDIGPLGDFTTDTLQNVRLFRRMTGGTGRLVLLDPGTTTNKAGMDTEGHVWGDSSGQFGEIAINGDGQGNRQLGYITTTHTGSPSVFWNTGRGSGQTQWFFSASDGTVVANVAAVGQAANDAQDIITREKGDARYNLQSSARYKENIGPMDHDLWDGVIDVLKPKRWIWGGELPESDNRIGSLGSGLIAEEVAAVFPPATRFDDEGKVDGIDPLALIGLLVEEVKSLRQRVQELEDG